MDSAEIEARPFPVAVVGMSCRFPGAKDVFAFWQLLRTGVDAVREVPANRWDVEYYYHPDPAQPGRTYARAGGFLDSIDTFDADFFGISPREARLMDPQQRILLELTWEALESAGIVPSQLTGSKTGVFVGAASNDYGILVSREVEGNSDPYAATGAAVSIIANRLSYIFDLHGPSFAIDTACSSSLVAVHEACASLWRGESGAAIVGGINVLLLPENSIAFAKASMLSPTGRCRTFDAAADGYTRAEGGAVIILKPLAAARRDGDTVLATILGSGVNSDGRTRGIALPNIGAQESLLQEVYRGAGVDPQDVSYIEAHGTGTKAGDRAECTALGHFFGSRRRKGDPLPIGSVKTNIGHLEPASGIAGLIKAILVLQNRELPPTVHFKEPNPEIPFAELNLSVVDRLVPMSDRGAAPVAGVSSFGFGGTNAHVILRAEEQCAAPARTKAADQPRAVPFFLSARGNDALKDMARSYSKLLRSPNAPPLADIAAAIALRRSHHSHRIALIGLGSEDIAAGLEAFTADQPALQLTNGEAHGKESRVAFVFSGNGSQWVGMGRELLADDPIFARCVADIDAVLQPLLKLSVLEVLRKDAPADLYDRTEIAQPALFALQLGIVETLRSRGITAEAMVGHSVGEISAAYAAGALSLEEACRVIACRSQAQGRTAGTGNMAAVGLSEAQAVEAIAPYGAALTVAGVNSPVSVTLAGDRAALEKLGESLKSRGVFFRLLALDYAFHSPAMDPIQSRVTGELATLSPQPATKKFISTVTGADCCGAALDAGYWWKNIRHPVRFSAAIEHLIEQGFDSFIEIGPHPILAAYLREVLHGRSVSGNVIATLKRGDAGGQTIWMTLARCYTAGLTPDFHQLFPEGAARIALPSYPWQRERHWFNRTGRVPLPLLSPRIHPLLGYRMPTGRKSWCGQLDPEKLTFLKDHVLHGSVLFPGSAYLEMAAAAAALHFATDAIEVEALEIRRPLVFSGRGEQWVELEIESEDNSFRVAPRENATAPQPPIAVGQVAAIAGEPSQAALDIEGICARLPERRSANEHYRSLAERGLAFGPSFQGVADLWVGAGEALGRIEAPVAVAAEAGDYHIHPALLDACFQVSAGVMPMQARDDRAAFVPVHVERARLYGRGGTPGWCHATLVRADRHQMTLRLQIYDAEAKPIAVIDGLQLQRFAFGRANEVQAWHWRAEPKAGPLGVQTSGDLPSPKSVVMEIRAEVAQLRARQDAFLISVAPALDRIAGLYARRALEELGLGNEPQSLASLIDGGRVSLARRSLLLSLLTIAMRHGFAAHSESGWMISGAAAADAPETAWRELMWAHPQCLASLEIVARCGEQLIHLLRGEVNAEAITHPDRDFNAGEQLLDSDPGFRAANDIAALVLAYVKGWTAADRPLRIIEIGGGSGAFASAILPVLPSDRVDYLLTDPDERALSRAETRLAAYPFVRFSIFNGGRDAGLDGMDRVPFDIVLATHALGRASEPSSMVAQIRSLVKPGGLALLIETVPGGFLDLVSALREVHQTDSDLEPATWQSTSPPARWMDLLTDAGFQDVVEVSEQSEGGADHVAVILARAPHGNGHAHADTPIQPRNWVVLAGQDDDRTSGLVRVLSENGQRVLTVHEDNRWERLRDDLLYAPLSGPDDYRRLVEAFTVEPERGLDVVYARGLHRPVECTDDDPMAVQEHDSFGLVLLTQALAGAGLSGRVRLWVLSSGAAAVPYREEPVDAAGAPIWGVARTLMNERPDMALRLIDIDPGDRSALAQQCLGAELLHPSDEDEIVLRGSARYVHRLHRGVPSTQRKVRGEDGGSVPVAHRLSLRVGDRPDGLGFLPIPMPEPGSGEVVVRVSAAGLNYRDVLQRVGILREEAFQGGFAGNALGMEFSGEVVALGPGVHRFKLGDAVFGFAAGAFASHVKVAVTLLLAKPPELSFESAATLPVAALTVCYSLKEVARIQRGESVLIHGGAGGVGLLAIQYAQALGAEVFASAGTPGKRAFLRRLGVRHVVDSRSLGFFDEIREITDGQGVDVVLNSLAGEALQKGVSLLKPYGRFVELGKRDFWANTKLGLKPFRNNIQFCGVDVDRLLVDRPAMSRDLLRDVSNLVTDGVLRPLPHRVFPASRINEAFRHMQQSRHIGKVVVDLTGEVELSEPPPAGRLSLRSDATYLVTGGRDGFGLATAQWLASKGARHLLLVGRSERTRPEAAIAIDRLRETGVAVREAAVDVADAAGLERLLHEIRGDLPPLRGVVHCAAIIEDAALANVTREQFRKIMRPKVLGAHNLDRLTRDMPLDFFIMYSSAVTLFGNPGQISYIAANIYLEALAERRRAMGRPALTVLWDAVDGVGHFAKNTQIAKIAVERLGVKLMAPERLLDRLEPLVMGASGVVALADLNWTKLTRLPRVARSPRYADVRPPPGETAATPGLDPSELKSRLAAMEPGKRHEFILQLVLGQLAAVLRMPATKLDGSRALTDLGLDSLMVVEWQLAMEQQFGTTISPAEVMEAATVSQLARKVADKLGAGPSTEPTAAPRSPAQAETDPPRPAVLEQITALQRGRKLDSKVTQR